MSHDTDNSVQSYGDAAALAAIDRGPEGGPAVEANRSGARGGARGGCRSGGLEEAGEACSGGRRGGPHGARGAQRCGSRGRTAAAAWDAAFRELAPSTDQSQEAARKLQGIAGPADGASEGGSGATVALPGTAQRSGRQRVLQRRTDADEPDAGDDRLSTRLGPD